MDFLTITISLNKQKTRQKLSGRWYPCECGSCTKQIFRLTTPITLKNNDYILRDIEEFLLADDIPGMPEPIENIIYGFYADFVVSELAPWDPWG